MGPPQGLDPATLNALASRLASDASLRVPAILSGQVQDKAPGNADRMEYLKALLERDPGVFLERHGEHLQQQDLTAFEGLRSDYEVDFFVRQLEQQHEASKARLTPQVRNRRLAQLNRLIDEGDFFSEAAMRGRQPLLHHQYVGQYQPQTSAPPPAPRSGSGHPLSDAILKDLDESVLQEHFAWQQEAEDAVEAESSDEEAYPEDRRAEVDQAPQQAAQQTGADSTAAAHPAGPPQPGTGAAEGAAAGDGGRKQQPGPADAAKPATRPEAARDFTEIGAAGAAGARASSAEQDQKGEEAENRPEAAPFVHIPEEERRQLAEDFLELMHQRFLAGEDEYDYQAVDADAALDDDWAAERQQDAEDAYFDSVE